MIHLQNSCYAWDIELEVEAVESRGSWEENVSMKPRFILNKLEKSEQPLLWVDADAVFLQKPDFSELLHYDFSVRFMEVFEKQREHAINAATIFMNQTKETLELVKRWVSRCEELNQDGVISFVDQIALYDVLLENKEAKVLRLPTSFCKIYDLDCFFINDEDVVIEQRQASRRFR